MSVGLVSVDSLIPNLALMRRSAYWKSQGASVEIASPLFGRYDRVEVSQMFDFSRPDDTPWGDAEVVYGGPGIDIHATFGPDHDTIYPDYSLYGCTYALGRISRGCPRNCAFCIVGPMDGTRPRQVAELSDFLHEQTHVRLIDDNLTAMPGLFIDTCHELTQRRTFTKWEALDVRLMTVDMVKALAKVRRWGQVHFAWDSMSQEDEVRRGIANLRAGGFPLYAATFYVLVGFDTTPEQDAYRIDELDALGVESFVMPFDKSDPYQKRLARDVNRKEIFRTTHPRRR